MPETQVFSAIPMVEGADYTIAELPYKSSKAHRIEVIQIGQSTRNKFVNGQPYVQDSQVLFKMPMHLPPQEAITKVYDAYIQLSLSKLSNLGHPKTEWICFLDQRVCSGQTYDEPGWQGNINSKFWGNLNNEFKSADFFSTSFIQGAGNKVGTTPQGWDLWLNESFTIKLEDILNKSNYKDVLAFLYDGVAANGSLDKALRVVVADDTRVSNAKLVFSYEEDLSKALELQSQQPAQQMPGEAAAPAKKSAVLKNVAKKVQ